MKKSRKYNKDRLMPVTVQFEDNTGPVVFISGSNTIYKIINALPDATFSFSYTAMAKATGLPITTIYDSWKKFCSRNDVRVEVVISGKKGGLNVRTKVNKIL